jgi:hypothetical protein
MVRRSTGSRRVVPKRPPEPDGKPNGQGGDEHAYYKFRQPMWHGPRFDRRSDLGGRRITPEEPECDSRNDESRPVPRVVVDLDQDKLHRRKPRSAGLQLADPVDFRIRTLAPTWMLFGEAARSRLRPVSFLTIPSLCRTLSSRRSPSAPTGTLGRPGCA